MTWSSDIECDRLKLVIMSLYYAIFCPFTHPTTPKNQKNDNFENMKKIVGDIIILHMCTKHYNHTRHSSRDTEWDKIFCPFTPLISQKITTWKNEKKYLKMSSFHTCTKNHNHMMYASWDIECNRHNFLSFWAIFCTFTPLTTQKIKILKKWKNPRRHHHFAQVFQKSWLYAILFLRYGMWQM